MGTFKEKAENLSDKLLDLAKNHPATWIIILVYTVLAVAVGGWLF